MSQNWTLEQVRDYQKRMNQFGNGTACAATPKTCNYSHREPEANRGQINAVASDSRKHVQNNTEREALRVLNFIYGNRFSAIYEGEHFGLAGGHIYTPDWILRAGEMKVCVEVKGCYRFGSQGRSKLAFADASERNPETPFVWIKKHKDGTWRFSIVLAGKERVKGIVQ